MIKISIITINLNNKAGLFQTCESLKNQTYKEFEYIIIDGGSSDGSNEVLQSYSKIITYSVTEQDTGIYNAMNKGISVAKGEYCLFLNSGDALSGNDILEKAIPYLDYDIVFGEGFRKSEGNSRTKIIVPEKPDLYYFSSNSLLHASTFIRRSLFERFGLYNEDNRIVSDWEFFIKTISVNQVSYRKIPMFISVIEDNGISRLPENHFLLNQEIQKVLEKYYSPDVIALLSEFRKKDKELQWINKNGLLRTVLLLRDYKRKWLKGQN